MFLELLGTFIAGFAAAGVVMGLRKLSRGMLPGWLVPVVAGATMIGTAVWLEYTWYGRTIDTLPAGLEVAAANDSQQFYRPWTYVVPLVNRFVALDTAGMKTHAAQPDQVIADLYLWERWRALERYPVLFDCAGSRRALVPGDAVYGADGAVEGALWTKVPGDDPVLSTACQRG